MRVAVRLVATGALAAALCAASAPTASAAPSALPHAVVGGFSTSGGGGFALVFADGSVRPGPSGDALALPLNSAMTGAAGVPAGGGYWEVGADGGVFSYGTARFLGSMGAAQLNQPVFSIAPTKTGKGYWLVARDGGIFSFGDARFFGSAGSLPLQEPIAGITTSATGRGYRLVARDGGIFDYGDAAFFGSLPGRGVHVSDVVGMAPTPTGKGYWIARSDGQVYAFGDAHPLENGPASSCDTTTAIIANPAAPGYRLATASGATFAFGTAPGGARPTGPPRQCGGVTARIELPSTTVVSGETMTGYLVVDNETGGPVSFPGPAPNVCQPKWTLALATSKDLNPPPITAECRRQPLVFPAGETQFPFGMEAVKWANHTPLTPGQYFATFVSELQSLGFPTVAKVPVRVVAAS
jgi:hypothetical protein